MRRLIPFLLAGVPLFAQTCFAQTWQVRPEWVKAHEDFLASDALQGRGSATRDEQIAATYIASQFAFFGLKAAPNAAAYMQSVELEDVQPDGQAVLTVGKRAFHEGADFTLIRTSGGPVTATLLNLAPADIKTLKPSAATALLLRGDPQHSPDQAALRQLFTRSRAGGIVMVEDSPAARELIALLAGRPKGRRRIKGSPAPPAPPGAFLVLNAGASHRLRRAKNGRPTTLAVRSTSSTRSTYNAVAMLPGTDPEAGAILITAHLDHLGVRPPAAGATPETDSIYNGANDDASGVTAVLELAHALAAGPAPRRTVFFACFGSEETGGFGAAWFLRHPPVALPKIAANIEFEQIGVAQEGVPTGTMFFTGWERSNLGPALKEHGARLSPDPFPDQNFFQRSDNYALALQGVVAHTASAGGEVPTYHKPNDDVDHIDLALMTNLIQSMIEPVRWLAGSDFVPAWNAGGQPKSGR